MSDWNRRFNLVSGKEIENLPSFGVGTLLSDAASATEVLNNIRNGPALNSTETERMRGGSGAGPSTMVAPATQDDDKTVHTIYVEESNQQELDESATEPIGTTIDHTQLMEEEAEEIKAPMLHARITTDYMRFRYMSEKIPQKKKGGRTRNSYEPYGDDDKHVLAEVRIDNYTGSAKIVAYCVHEDGHLHPYNLFGDACFHGVYVKKENIRPEKILRLAKVSVTTPKEKEYEKTLKNQQSYLSTVGVEDVKTKKEVSDKQIVYIMFKAILEDGTILSCMSSPIQNKKKGKEFKIEDMEPVSGPASGDCGTNIQKNRVMICVTEGTNFPADVGVKVREKHRDGAVIWEAEPNDISVIKQCVVKFIPPAYKNPRTNVDVQVEICLYDKKTKIETEPVPYIYYPVLDTFGLAKKRKLDEDDYPANFSQHDLAGGTRKFLSGIRKSSTSAAKRNSCGSSSEQSGSSQENSVQYVEEMSENPADLRSVDPAVLAEATISLLGQKNVQVPFTSYTEGQNVGHSIFGTATSQQPTRPESSGFSSEQASSSSRGATPSSSQHPSFLGNQASLVTSTTSVFGSSQQTTSSHTYSSSPAISVGSSSSQQLQVPVKVEQQQQQQQVSDPGDNLQFLSDEDMMMFVQQGVNLPKLGPNQSIAVINGQIYVVNDDINEASTVPPPSSTYQPPPAIIQNIGHQQVIVQQIAPQQPSSEAKRHTTQLSGATSLASQNQNSGFSAAGSSQNAFQSAPLLSAVAQQQTLLQQQQQQQLQQQLQLLQQLLGPTGIDLASIPLAQQLQLLQQVGNLQNQSSQQQNQASRSSAGTISYGTNLNDDDVEIDGETYTNGEQANQIVIQITEETEQRNKKLKSSNTNQRRANLSQKVVVETVKTSGQIPTLVNEDSQDGNIEEQSSKRGGKHIDFRYQNGSFGDEASSSEEDDV